MQKLEHPDVKSRCLVEFLPKSTFITRTYALSLKPRSPVASLKKGGTSKAPFLTLLGELSA
jgi:hypothetical protein